MRVVAISPGDVGGQVRFPGDKLDMPDGAKGSWFRPVGSGLPPAAASAKSGRVPQALVEAQTAEIAAARAQGGAGVGTGEGHKLKVKAKHGDDMT